MTYLAKLSELPAPIVEIARTTDAAGGAVLVFDSEDRVLIANAEQRRIMPCCRFDNGETYSSIFWTLLEHGMNGNPIARKIPEQWLARAIGARQNCQNMDFVNSYPWGKMLVSHFRLDSGISIQARLNMTAAGLESHFQGHEACFGVTRALRLRSQIKSLEGVLDSLGLAVALVDRDGRVLHENASFSEMVVTGDGLTKPFGTALTAADACDDLVLRQALAFASDRMVPRSYVPIRRRASDPLVLAVSPGATPGTAVLAVARFGENMIEVNAALRQAFGLTAAESDVMAGVGAGQTLAEFAGNRGIAMQTAYRNVDRAKKRLKNNGFAAPDLSGISSLVTGIAAITRGKGPLKH